VIPESGTRRKNGPIIAHLRKNGQIIDPNDEWRICTACPSRFSRNVWTVRAATPQTKKDFEVRRIARSRSQTKMTVARKSDKNLLSQLTLAAESLEVETPSKLTKPKTNYSQLKDKARELRNVKVQLRKVCDGFLAKLENTLAEDLKVNCLAGLYDNKEDGDTAEMDQLVKLQKSVANLYQSIPCNSPIRTSIMKTLFSKNDAGFIAKTLDIDGRNVSRALSEEKQDLAKPLSYYLTNIGFKRDRVKAKGPPLLKFLKECGVPSGRNKRYFVRGTPESMYAEYKLKCIEKGDKFVGPEKFHKVRKHERVGILQGDIFSNPKKNSVKKLQIEISKVRGAKRKSSNTKSTENKNTENRKRA